MATVPKERRSREIDYPTGDGKPVAETALHLLLLFDTVQLLRDYYATRPNLYVGANMLLFYEEGNRRKHIAPDVFVAIGVPKRAPTRPLSGLEREQTPGSGCGAHLKVDSGKITQKSGKSIATL
jgi:hypothetical protein